MDFPDSNLSDNEKIKIFVKGLRRIGLVKWHPAFNQKMSYFVQDVGLIRKVVCFSYNRQSNMFSFFYNPEKNLIHSYSVDQDFYPDSGLTIESMIIIYGS